MQIDYREKQTIYSARHLLTHFGLDAQINPDTYYALSARNRSIKADHI
jgi:hypothetical protein